MQDNDTEKAKNGTGEKIQAPYHTKTTHGAFAWDLLTRKYEMRFT